MHVTHHWRPIAFEDTILGLGIKEGELIHITCVGEGESKGESEGN